MKNSILIIILILMDSCSMSSKTDLNNSLNHIDIIFIHPLELECRYSYTFNTNTLFIGCAIYSEKTSGEFKKYCVKSQILDKEIFQNVMNIIENQGNKIYEKNNITDGFYLKILLTKNKTTTLQLFNRFNEKELEKIDPAFLKLFNLLEKNRCL